MVQGDACVPVVEKAKQILLEMLMSIGLSTTNVQVPPQTPLHVQVISRQEVNPTYHESDPG